ncbi:MAG TPA: TonB-dependent receptor, partial [Gemmatimonadales bacterium]|nr:TonB-dependent receptor [Gemmatimonadales bacterium]
MVKPHAAAARRPRRRALAALMAWWLGAPVSLPAQHEPTGRDSTAAATLQPITVVGARVPSVAPPVETIEVSAEQLERTPASGPYDMVRRTAGIEVHEQGQGPGFASDAVIRGFTSDHSSDVLLVVDGVPINLPLHGHVEGYADWSVLTPASLASLRVIHGPSSPLYGDFAFGGVVEARTADDAAGSVGTLRGSSFGDVGGWARTGRRGQASGGLLAVDGLRQQGWRENSDYWLGNAVAHGWRRGGAGRMTGGVMLYGSSWNSPGFVSVARYNADDLEAATDTSDGGSAARLILHGHYHVPTAASTSFESSLWAQGVRSSVFLNIPHDDLLAQSEEEDRREAVGGDARLVWRPGTGEVTAGLSGRADWVGYELYDTESRVRGSQTQANDGRYQSGAAYVRWRGLLGQRVAYDLGARLDLIHYASLDRLTPDAAWEDETRLLPSPKLGVRYLLGDRVSLQASLAHGFRGAVGTIADPSRHPVTSWAKEIGASWLDERTEIRVAFFRFDVAHERILDPVTREVTEAGESVRQGISADVSITPRAGLRVTADATWNDAEITEVDVTEAGGTASAIARAALVTGWRRVTTTARHEEPLEPGAQVPGVARYTGRIGLEAALTESLESRAALRLSGPFTPIGEPGIRTQAYALVDLGGTVRLGRAGPRLDLDLLNVLDAKYP